MTRDDARQLLDRIAAACTRIEQRRAELDPLMVQALREADLALGAVLRRLDEEEPGDG